MIEVLTELNTQMEVLGLNYEYDTMTQNPPAYPYWVGEYTVTDGETEDGREDVSVILVGFARGNLLQFEQEKEIIKNHFKHGVRVMTSAGSAVVFFFSGIVNLPIDDPDLRKCQITLDIKHWRGD